MTDSDSPTSVPDPIEYGVAGRTYPVAPEPAAVTLPDDGTDAPWTVRSVCRRFRVPGANAKVEPLTDAETGVEVDPTSTHIEAVLRREPSPRTTGLTADQHRLHFATVETCRAWLERADGE